MKTPLITLLLFCSLLLNSQDVTVDTILGPFNVGQELAILASGDIAFATRDFFDGETTVFYRSTSGELTMVSLPGGDPVVGLIFEFDQDAVYFATKNGEVLRHDRFNNDLVIQWSLLPEGMESGFFIKYLYQDGKLYAFGAVYREGEQFNVLSALDMNTGEVTAKYLFTLEESAGGLVSKDENSFLVTRIGLENTDLLVLDNEMNLLDSTTLSGIHREVLYFTDQEIYFTSEVEERHFISRGDLSGNISPFWEAINKGHLAVLRKGPDETILWADQEEAPLTGNTILYHIGRNRELISRGVLGVLPPYELLVDMHLNKNEEMVFLANGNVTDVGDVFTPNVGRFFVNTTSTRQVKVPEVRVFPNPAIDDFVVDLPAGVQIENLQLFNSEGRLIRVFQQGELLTLQGLSFGSYWFRLTTDNGKILNGRVTKS